MKVSPSREYKPPPPQPPYFQRPKQRNQTKHTTWPRMYAGRGLFSAPPPPWIGVCCVVLAVWLCGCVMLSIGTAIITTANSTNHMEPRRHPKQLPLQSRLTNPMQQAVISHITAAHLHQEIANKNNTQSTNTATNSKQHCCNPPPPKLNASV